MICQNWMDRSHFDVFHSLVPSIDYFAQAEDLHTFSHAGGFLPPYFGEAFRPNAVGVMRKARLCEISRLARFI